LGLIVNNITFGFLKNGDTLNNISLEVKRGQTHCVLGASGSGKSTLLKIISGLIKPRKQHHIQSSVIFDGNPVDTLKLKGKLSFMFQDPCLLPHLNVRQNIALPVKMSGKINTDSIDELLSIVGLNAFPNKLPFELSGGMRTRTALARSFISQPSLLLLDEAFSGLDQGWKYELYKELKILQTRNQTAIVMVTHDLDEALALGDSLSFLDYNGRLRCLTKNEQYSKDELRKELIDLISENHINNPANYA
jgi:ABC-type nitrate/sulfonate/bicarbonate transport system ATPase subunit